MKPLSIVFAGTPDFSVPALEALLRSKHRVVAVYTQPDRPAGRGQHVAMSAVKSCALRNQLPVEQPPTLRAPDGAARLASWSADLMVVVAYGLILPRTILHTPRLGCVNIHASLLPRWRGAAPIQRAILAGDTQTGATIMQMDEGLDTGPALLERATAIGDRETASQLHDRLAILGAQALLEALDAIASGSLRARPQPAEGATYAAKISKDEARIDWTLSAVQVDRQVRAFNSWPVAETSWQGKQLRVWEAVPLDSKSAAASPGTVIATSAAGIDVATGAGVLRLTRVQVAGRKAMSAAQFLNAHRLEGPLGS